MAISNLKELRRAIKSRQKFNTAHENLLFKMILADIDDFSVGVRKQFEAICACEVELSEAEKLTEELGKLIRRLLGEEQKC